MMNAMPAMLTMTVKKRRMMSLKTTATRKKRKSRMKNSRLRLCLRWLLRTLLSTVRKELLMLNGRRQRVLSRWRQR